MRRGGEPPRRAVPDGAPRRRDGLVHVHGCVRTKPAQPHPTVVCVRLGFQRLSSPCTTPKHAHAAARRNRAIAYSRALGRRGVLARLKREARAAALGRDLPSAIPFACICRLQRRVLEDMGRFAVRRAGALSRMQSSTACAPRWAGALARLARTRHGRMGSVPRGLARSRQRLRIWFRPQRMRPCGRAAACVRVCVRSRRRALTCRTRATRRRS